MTVCSSAVKVSINSSRLEEIFSRQSVCRSTSANVPFLDETPGDAIDDNIHFERTINEKKRSEETQTLHAGCSKAEPKSFAQPQTPYLGARDGQNLISWRRSPTFTYFWWWSIHEISSYRGNRPTHTHTNTHTPSHPHSHKQSGPITIHCAAALLARSVITHWPGIRVIFISLY